VFKVATSTWRNCARRSSQHGVASDPLCGRAAPLRIHTHNARIATSKDVADELWWMATKYQDQAARLGEAPELGDEPPLWKLAR
jgi:hypothetical protein